MDEGELERHRASSDLIGHVNAGRLGSLRRARGEGGIKAGLDVIRAKADMGKARFGRVLRFAVGKDLEIIAITGIKHGGTELAVLAHVPDHFASEAETVTVEFQGAVKVSHAEGDVVDTGGDGWGGEITHRREVSSQRSEREPILGV